MTKQIVEILKYIVNGIDNIDWNEINLLEEEIIDSIKIVELVEKLEEVYNIRISPMDLESKNFESVGAIECLIQKNISG